MGSSESPLAGRRIAITRPGAQGAAFATALEARGAEPIVTPLVTIEDVAPGAMRTAALGIERYDWLVFTSANAVTRFWRVLRETGDGERAAFGRVRICAVGPATAAAVAREGREVDLLPDEYVGEGLVEAMRRAGGVQGRRVLYPRAERSRPTVAEGLRGLGAEVDEVVAYRTVEDAKGAATLKSMLSRGEIDVITFTSGSAVDAFVAALGPDPGSAAIATIGPITSTAATAAGLEVAIEADPHTIDGLVEAIARWFADLPAD